MKVRTSIFMACALLAIGAVGCAASADGSGSDQKGPAQHVWPSKDAGTQDAGKTAVDAGPPWTAFEADGGTTGGTGGGTGGTGGGTGGGGTGGGGTGGGGTGGGGLDACGICDRAWQCDAALDDWASDGTSACVDSRTGTTLNCDGTMRGGGTWSGDATEMILAFPNVGGGSFDVTCTPP